MTKYETDSLCEIHFGDSSVVSTVNHRFYDPREKLWKAVCPFPGTDTKYLKVNDYLLSFD